MDTKIEPRKATNISCIVSFTPVLATLWASPPKKIFPKYSKNYQQTATDKVTDIINNMLKNILFS